MPGKLIQKALEILIKEPYTVTSDSVISLLRQAASIMPVRSDSAALSVAPAAKRARNTGASPGKRGRKAGYSPKKAKEAAAAIAQTDQITPIVPIVKIDDIAPIPESLDKVVKRSKKGKSKS